MYKVNKPNKTTLRVNNSKEGETIENKVRRIMKNGEPIEDGAPLIYSERKDGVLPEYDIRTDRWDLAVEATERITKANLAKREGNAKIEKTSETTDAAPNTGEASNNEK